MSEVGGHESFLWETQSWAFLNSDNSSGTDQKFGGRPPDSGSNTQTPTGKEAAGAAGGKKRSEGSKIGGGSGEVSEGKGGGGGGESDHEIHIWTERERRKKMRNMFSNLHALLPQLPPKADKSTIIDEAVNYIKTVQQSLQKLQRKKLERLHNVTTSVNFDSSVIVPQKLGVDTREAFAADQVSSNSNSNSSGLVARFPLVFQSWTSQNVVLNVCGDQAQISVCAPKKPGLFTAICFVMEKHKLDVVSAHVSSDQNRTMFMIQAHARIALDQLQEAFPVDEIFKQAAGEIMLWISNLETF